MIIFLIIFLTIFIILYLLNNLFIKNNKINNKNNKEYFDTEEYKKLMLNNDKKKLYRIMLDKKIEILRDECYERCDKKKCILLDDKTKWLEKCLKCNIQDKKCFNKSIIGGNCDDCDVDNIDEKLDCLAIENYGCPNPNNLSDLSVNDGIKPYYIEVPDNNVNSPFNKKCVFCWNIMDNI
jgi:hypothetical protein